MVRSSISLASIEMQMKTTLKYHYLYSRIVTIKKKSGKQQALQNM